MNNSPISGKTPCSVIPLPDQVVVKAGLKSFRRTSFRTGAAERVAVGMIARHGANAAREAASHLNRMIDLGNLPARDLWACVVHVIHELRDEVGPGEHEAEPPRLTRIAS
jgi:hypothetical protein